MEIAFIKQGNGLWRPAFEEDKDRCKVFKVDTPYKFKIEDANRSVIQHRMCFKFITFLFENQDHTDKIDKFRSALLLTLGYTEISYRKIGKGKYETIEIPMSMRFEKMSQKRFNQFFKDLQVFAKDALGIDFEEWKRNEWKAEGACQMPYCHNPATDRHEIVPGNYRRQYCIEKGYQIDVCRQHHQQAHGIFESMDERMNGVQYEMFKTFCEILELEAEKVWAELYQIKKGNIPLEED